jgi:hypothetical protein
MPCNYVGRYENFVDTRPQPAIDVDLASKDLDFVLKLDNEYAWNIHREVLASQSEFFENALSIFEVRAHLRQANHH